MSSNYHVLCLAHDPAIIIDGGWNKPTEALHAVAHREDDEALQRHLTCDLVVGRYSYPLIEAACPPGRCPTGGYHADEVWTDVTWLRLLAAAHRSGDAAVLTAANGVRCWTAERVHRMRDQIGEHR